MDTTYRINDVYAVILDEVRRQFTMDGCTLDGAVQVSDQLEVNYYISVSVDSYGDEDGHDVYDANVDDVLLYYHNTETDEEVELDTDEFEEMLQDVANEELNEMLGEEDAWEDTKRSICQSYGWSY